MKNGVQILLKIKCLFGWGLVDAQTYFFLLLSPSWQYIGKFLPEQVYQNKSKYKKIACRVWKCRVLSKHKQRQIRNDDSNERAGQMWSERVLKTLLHFLLDNAAKGSGWQCFRFHAVVEQQADAE